MLELSRVLQPVEAHTVEIAYTAAASGSETGRILAGRDFVPRPARSAHSIVFAFAFSDHMAGTLRTKSMVFVMTISFHSVSKAGGSR